MQFGHAGWNRLSNHHQLVYEMPLQVAMQFHAAAPPSAQVKAYRSLEELPASVVSYLTNEHGGHVVALLESTFRGGATLFLVMYEGSPANMLWGKRGAPERRWYLPLTSTDVVLYGAHTSPQYRGLNLMGLAMEFAFALFSAQTERFLVDVKIWNKPSIRGIEKAGFRFLMKTKPLA